MNIEFKDHSEQVLAEINKRINKALTALGFAVVNVTKDYIDNRYGRKIWISGDLYRSITFAPPDIINKTVTIGSNMEYAGWVHNGTARMEARPFLRDAIMENMDIWREVIAEHLGSGWGIKVNI